MRFKISTVVTETKKRAYTALEIVGLVGVAVAVGHLASGWWGALVGSIAAVLYANLSDG